ncbi:hypothetical protein BN14_05325 [Rhizoctonia solani AG-1 IB]|uniref:CCHC-type domain-containing protein n=1 Tax=Thanatephorus cucumeris (strain AG1-IB / isolate 7/3/14) TaxID=1108050 RepID=M5BVN1_THACB|nr:hypothetical protein BN14_05325 [Rhizoctonia solani AG-1 IB]
MATPSQPATTLGQPQHQGLLSPFGETPTHPGSTTLDDVHDLLHWLITAVLELTTRVAETEEATKDVHVTVKSISQQVNIIAGKVDEPQTPEQVNPVQTHWHVKQQLAQKEDQPQDLETLIAAAAIHINNVRGELEISQPPCENRPKPPATTPTPCTANTGTPRIDSDQLKANPNYVSEAERQRQRDEKLCIKCGKARHRFAECHTGWKGPDKGKETAKVAEMLENE